MRWVDGMLRIWPEDDLIWPVALKPRGLDTLNPEQVEDLYDRNLNEVGHLHPLIAAQWIHRHRQRSPYRSFPLGAMLWSLYE